MFNIKAFLNLTYYTSELDQFLFKYDQRHPRQSASQRQEIEKYARIYRLRDNTEPQPEKTSFWDKF
jgi:hypothetical protein